MIFMKCVEGMCGFRAFLSCYPMNECVVQVDALRRVGRNKTIALLQMLKIFRNAIHLIPIDCCMLSGSFKQKSIFYNESLLI